MTRHLLVIGAQRCGTTYLSWLLESHADITMARPWRPEPKVFLSDEASGRGYDWYLATYFPHARGESVLGEKSTSYIEDAAAPARVAGVLTEPVLLAMVRDPVARAVSNWAFSTDNGLETRPLAEALRSNLTETQPWEPGATSVSPYAYLERGRFTDHLTAWDRQFPGALHVVFLDDLLADRRNVSRVYAALGVDDAHLPADVGAPVNASSAADVLDTALAAELRDYFADSDAALQDLVARPLPWRAEA